MTWIRKVAPSESAEVAAAAARLNPQFPAEYDQAKRGERRGPEIVKSDSIILAHSLIPRAMEGIFAGYAALLDPQLPLSRREQEMIATTVAALNRCFY